MADDFKLSATLRGHEEDVRALSFPDRTTLFSASRDNTVRRWSLVSPHPPAYDDTIALQGSNWFNGLAYAPPTDQSPEGLVAAGGRETFVYVKRPGAPTEEDPHRLLIGHAGNITCLAFSQDGRKLVSGGWDSQVFVWDVEQGHVAAELAGHGGPVWAVMVYDSKLVLTACADKIIRVFDLNNGKSLAAIKGHTDVVRSFCKLPPDHWSGAQFASAGNDELVRLWTLDGAPMGELAGHEAYIYSLAVLPNGDIVSSSEDRTVRVWRDGRCIQTITHPAISIWVVAACEETGDIVSGASDNIIRVFSRSPERQADAETVNSFEESNRMYAIPAETASQGQPFQKENLPGPEALQTQVGQRDGQQLFIREHDGSVTAHLWSTSTSQWNLIGTVVSGEGSGGNKKEYRGKQYDYVFDVDIKDGEPPLKLAYNLSESAWDAARRFLEQNELPLSYYEQVANFITENTRGARIGQDSSNAASQPPQGQDPWGMERRYRPGDAGASSMGGQRILPQRSYVDILEGNAQAAVKKISDTASELRASGKIDASSGLTAEESEALEALVQQLNNSPRDPHPTTEQTNALLKVATQWPRANRVPAVALLARLAVSRSFVSTTSAGDRTITDTLQAAGLLEQRQETANNAVHAIRLITNLFASDSGRLIADGSFDQILQLVRPFASEPESGPQFKALATLYLNFSVLLTSNAPSSESQTRESRAEILLVDIARMLECESTHAANDAVALLRTLTALGTLLALGDEFRAKMKMGVSGTLHLAATKPAAQQGGDVQRVVQEIWDELR